MPTASIDWNEDKVAELKRHHSLRLSAAQIGARMNATRNTILGKLNRLGLSSAGVPRLSSEHRELSAKRRAEAAVVRKRNQRHSDRGVDMQETQDAPPPFIGALNIPFGDLSPYLSSAPNQCRFIADDPAGPNYLACGNETLPGESWCGHCRDIVFNRGHNISDEERERRSRSATRNFSSAQVKSYGAPREEAA